MNKEIDRLADFLLKNYPDEIGAGDPVHGESAVDVTIRLLSKETDMSEEADEYEPDLDAERYLSEPNPNSLLNRFKRWMKGVQS